MEVFLAALISFAVGAAAAIAGGYFTSTVNYNRAKADRRRDVVLDTKRLLAGTLSSASIILSDVQVEAWDFQNRGGMFGGNTIEIPERGMVYRDAWRRVDEWDRDFYPVKADLYLLYAIEIRDDDFGAETAKTLRRQCEVLSEKINLLLNACRRTTEVSQANSGQRLAFEEAAAARGAAWDVADAISSTLKRAEAE
jgi:hypothetical protein